MWLEGTTGSRIVGAGANNWGTLGDGTLVDKTVPTAPVGLVGDVVEMLGSGGAPMTVYVVMTNGDMYSWGYNGKYNVGDGTTNNRNTPFKVMTGVQRMFGNVQGWYFTPYNCPAPVVQKTDGTTWCWGANNWGQAGTGSIGGYVGGVVRMRLPVDIEIRTVATITGYNDGIIRLVVTLDNHVYAFGYNIYNTIDSSSVDHFYTPVLFSPSALLK
jgi:alpha-tubulin suppressor-like RCC1 family protein